MRPRGRLSLSYLHVAEPLDLESINHDVHEARGYERKRVDEIVLWQHQLDWIAKLVRTTGIRRFSACPPMRFAVDYGGSPEATLHCVSFEEQDILEMTFDDPPQATLYGVPVRVNNPERRRS